MAKFEELNPAEHIEANASSAQDPHALASLVPFANELAKAQQSRDHETSGIRSWMPDASRVPSWLPETVLVGGAIVGAGLIMHGRSIGAVRALAGRFSRGFAGAETEAFSAEAMAVSGEGASLKFATGVTGAAGDALKAPEVFLRKELNEGGAVAAKLDAETLSRIEAIRRKQEILSSGTINDLQLLDPQWGHVYTGTIRGGIGDSTKVVVHFPTNSYADFEARMHSERSALELSPYLFNTVEPFVQRIVPHNGGAFKTMVREFVGQDLHDVVRTINPAAHNLPLAERLAAGEINLTVTAKRKIGDRLYDLMARNSGSRKTMEEAMAERSAFGDTDPHEWNKRGVIAKGELARVINIDMESALHTQPIPTWPIEKSDWLTHKLHSQPLTDSTVDGFNRFLGFAHQSWWRNGMQKGTGMTDAELGSVISRSEWFAREKRFPSLAETPAPIKKPR